MKRRYTVLFALSVIAMVGWSWHATTSGTSVWSMIDIGLFGLILATFVAGLCTFAGNEERGSLFWIIAGSLLGAGQVPENDGGNGVAVALILIGSISTFLASIFIAVMPPPRERAVDGVASARVLR